MNNLCSPLVSVCMITYNHEAYIKVAIEGVLMQKTNFPIELIIGEDCSTDNTRVIVKEYKDKYPSIITSQYPESNRGMMNNFIAVLKSARGKYIALCEGDDYWTYPLKLQKQVDFMEANSEFAICFHKVRILKNDKLANDFITNVPAEITTIEDLAKGNFIHTPSVMFRNQFQHALPAWFTLSPVGDYVLHLLNAQFGKIKYINEAMAVYRLHETSYWSSQDQINRLSKWIKMQDLLIRNFPPNIGEIIKQVQTARIMELIELLQNQEKYNINEYIHFKDINPELLIKNYQEKIKQIYSSKDYKIGNTILKPIRFLKNYLNKNA